MSDGILRPAPKPVRVPKKPKARAASVRGAKSGGRLFPKNVSLSRRAFIRRERCIATGRKSGEIVTWQPWMPESWKAICPYVCKVIPAHVESHGSGHPDEGDMVPLDNHVHLHLQHGWGWPEFARRLKLMPPREIAQRFETRYRAANRKSGGSGDPNP